MGLFMFLYMNNGILLSNCTCTYFYLLLVSNTYLSVLDKFKTKLLYFIVNTCNDAFISGIKVYIHQASRVTLIYNVDL